MIFNYVRIFRFIKWKINESKNETNWNDFGHGIKYFKWSSLWWSATRPLFARNARFIEGDEISHSLSLSLAHSFSHTFTKLKRITLILIYSLVFFIFPLLTSAWLINSYCSQNHHRNCHKLFSCQFRHHLFIFIQQFKRVVSIEDVWRRLQNILCVSACSYLYVWLR